MGYKKVTKEAEKKAKKIFVELKKYIPLQRFNKLMIVLQIKSKEK